MQVRQRRKSRKISHFFKYLYVRAAPGGKNRGILQAGPVSFHCALGRNGITAFKREGDGATPLAVMGIVSGFCKTAARPLPRCGVLMRHLRPSDGWCDAPGDANYNRPVRLPHRSSAEAMLRADMLYDIGFVLDWNMRPRRINGGSAIFLHLAKPGYAATQGCIALNRRDMERLMPYLRPGTKLAVVR